MVNISSAQKLSSPNPFALITSKGEQYTNLMALSWWTYCCNRPATVAICIGQRSYSGRCIQQTGEFCLCLPGEQIADAAFRCGTCSGADHNKAADFGIDLVPSTVVAPAHVAESRLVLECKVTQSLPVGDHQLFLAEVVASHENPHIVHVMAEEGYGRLAPSR